MHFRVNIKNNQVVKYTTLKREIIRLKLVPINEKNNNIHTIWFLYRFGHIGLTGNFNVVEGLARRPPILRSG